MSQNCLNCEQQTHNAAYCSSCGQKTTTHRYSLQHFVMHDFVHGVFHFDKGFFYTVKELFTRPGHSIREFIQGKRAKHFNYITMLIILITINVFLTSMAKVLPTEFLVSEDNKGIMERYNEFIAKNPKLTMFLLIPINAFCSFIFFRKSKLNYTEHLVINTFITSSLVIIGMLFTILTLFYSNMPVLRAMYGIMTLLYFIYSCWFFFQFFSAYGYSKPKLIWKSFMATFLPYLISMIIGMAIGFVLYMSK